MIAKDDQLSRLSPMFYYMRFRIGICVPSTCDSGDMLSISQALSSSLKLNITVDTCRFKQSHVALSTNQLLAGSIAASIILLVLGATLMDYWRQSSDKLLRKKEVEMRLMGGRCRQSTKLQRAIIDGANCPHEITSPTCLNAESGRPISRVMRLPTSKNNNNGKNTQNTFQVITDFSQNNPDQSTNDNCYATPGILFKRAKFDWIWRSFSLIANFKLYFQSQNQINNLKMRNFDRSLQPKQSNANIAQFLNEPNPNTNSKTTTTSSNNHQLINCLNGIRVISLCWVIVANSYVTLDPRATKGLTRTREAPRDFLFQLIVQASLAIETFFFLSGLLMSLSFSRYKLSDLTWNKNVKKQSTTSSSNRINILNWFRFYFHRYIRLTAPAMLIIALAMFAHRYGDGPLWHEVTHRAHFSCSQNWWRHLLHIANFIDTRQTCFIHYWYIAADMQLFLIAPILLLLLNKFARFGALLISSLGLSSIYWIFHTTYMRNLPPTLLFYSSDPE